MRAKMEAAAGYRGQSVNYTKEEMEGWGVRDLKKYLSEHYVNTAGCVERQDLVALAIAHETRKQSNPPPKPQPQPQASQQSYYSSSSSSNGYGYQQQQVRSAFMFALNKELNECFNPLCSSNSSRASREHRRRKRTQDPTMRFWAWRSRPARLRSKRFVLLLLALASPCLLLTATMMVMMTTGLLQEGKGVAPGQESGQPRGRRNG